MLGLGEETLEFSPDLKRILHLHAISVRWAARPSDDN
jgi:hypothetical protein